MEVGLGFLPANAGLIAGSALGGVIVRRWSHRVAAGSGLALLAAGIAVLATITEDSTVWHPFLTGWLIFGHRHQHRPGRLHRPGR
ncbi:hypothetical protein [Microlunatus parietis]|uniref:Putative MFS family arabinose efflux permease n=1 Tax=Microlunatus parietis TaxID=682979 RepID=A0A7Y9IAS7_9ACTN|nr:hypothetical protein [Microlunatus parietis]NYE73389.1 putative MFS family arabinose efflux permease [Microlunatus parietis]